MTFTPTAEQTAIIDFAKNEKANLAVIARAGAAKTSTLVLIANALPKTQILCLAFNKTIADEMKERLPANCTSKTLHSIGYGVWARARNIRLTLRSNKTYQALRDILKDLQSSDPDLASDVSEDFGHILKLVSSAKSCGYLPDHSYPVRARSRTSREDFLESLPQEISPEYAQIVDNLLISSFIDACNGSIDYDDMIYAPCVSVGMDWPNYPLTLVDESQDLSPLNHYMVKKIVSIYRVIAVGDPCQAIYGFRGALTDSMEKMIVDFKMQTLYLTISFRCPKAVTKNVHWRAPDMQWPEWAEEGVVRHLTELDAADIPDGAAIICRNNAPLFSTALKLIRAGRSVEIRGRDILNPIKKILAKLGDPEFEAALALEGSDQLRKEELRKCREGAVGEVEDKYQIVRTLLSESETVGGALELLQSLLNAKGRILLMTGHKSKGLEFSVVYFLNVELCRADKYEQDANIRYVIETRAMKELYYIDRANIIA